MAGLSAPPVEKEELLEALSNRENASATLAEGAFEGDRPDSGFDLRDEDEEDDQDFFDEDDEFQQFLDEPEEGDFVAGLPEAEESEAHLGSQGVSSAVRPGGIIATYRGNEELRGSLADQSKVKSLEKLRHDYAARTAAAEDAKSALEDEEQKLRELRKRAQAGNLADPARLGYQEREVTKAWGRLTDSERARDAAELALHRINDEGKRVGQAARKEVAQATAIASERQLREVKRAKKVIERDQGARRLAEDVESAQAGEQERKAAEARTHQRLGVTRLKETHGNHKARLEEVDQVRESRYSHDAQRILNLKASQDAINNQIQSSNERKQKKQQKIQEERNQRKKEMLNDGLNPYEVWRREEMEAETEKQKQKLQALNEMRSEKLLEQLMTEDTRYKKILETEKTKRVEGEEFQRQMGNYAKEKKIAAYIRKMTIGNVDVLDPTGTAIRIDPSKITVQKTHAFGLGRARPEEIEKVDRDLRSHSARLAVGKKEETQGSEHAGSEEAASAQGSEDGPEVRGDGKLWVPNLTKLELQYLEAAKERQKQNITSVQRCWGKEFKGDAFLAKPSIIAFNDFEVGKRYRQVVEVTNVSLTFNQFKLLPLDDKVKEFFDIHFVPPGRMSAGVTRYITIWFSPKVSADIVSTFPILAKTGRIDFPLRCTTKKTILTVTPQDADAHPVIDFGCVLAGESADRVLSVKNTGALGASYELEPAEAGNALLPMLTWAPQKSDFTAHATTKVSFTFKPKAVGTYSTVLRLSIANGAAGDAAYTEEKRVLVRGSCVDVPIYVEKEEYDMKTCVYGHIFRESVVIHNRQSVAMKIQVEKPTQIENELSVNPALAYIQGNKEQVIQVKFSPKQDFFDRNPKYKDSSRPGEAGAFRIPVRIVGADQVLPVCTVLVGTLTTNDVHFDPPSLSFGRCFVGSSVVSRVTVVNDSLLPQTYAFMRLPSFLSVQDVPSDVIDEERVDASGTGTAVLEGGGDGSLGALLPKERRQLCVSYHPEAATEMDYNIVFKVITGKLCTRDFSINCQGQGVAPVLSLSHNQVDMASIPCDTVTKESVVVTNVSKVPYIMNLLLPPPEVSALYASLACCVLKPQESRRLQIEFKPTSDYTSLLVKPEEPKEESGEGEGEVAAAPPPAEGEGEGEEKPPQGPTPEEYRHAKLKEIREHGGRRWEGESGGTIHSSWKLAICMRPQPSKASQEGGGRAPDSKRETITYLGVGTCVLPSRLTVSPAILDFGEVTAHQRKLLPLTLESLDPSQAQELHVDALPENQCFTVLSAPRNISSKPFQLMIDFKPQLVQIYQSMLQLRTQNTRVQVPIRGRGVRPVLKIEPENGVIHMGSVCYSKEGKDYTTSTLVIKNDSAFELYFSLETVVGAQPNYAGPPPFALTPSTGTVEANGEKTVTVTFRPHRPISIFKEKVLVNVPNQKEPTYVYLYGHCFKYQGYAIMGMELGPFGRAQAKSSPAFVDTLALGTGAEGSSTGDNARQRDFSLVFEHGERMKYLLIGTGVPPGTPSAPQNSPASAFDFQILPSDHAGYFTVEAPEGGKPEKQVKGPIPPGGPGKPAMKLCFRYNPPEDTSLTYGDVNLSLLGGIGQWITCKVKGLLTGGYVPPGEPAVQELTVELRAYLQQI